MDAEIDLAIEQGPVELLGPQALSADLRKRAVLDLVARGLDLDDLDPAVGPALRGLDRRGDLARLRQRERRSASPEAKSLHPSPPSAKRDDQAKGRTRNECHPRSRKQLRRQRRGAGDERPPHYRPGGRRPDAGAPALWRR